MADMKPTVSPFLFKPGGAYRVRRSTYTDTPLPARRAVGRKSARWRGHRLCAARGPPGPVTLEMLDAAGKLVRKILQHRRAEATMDELPNS